MGPLRLRLSGTSPAGNAEHVVLVGGSQCGKSTSAEALIRGCRNLVVIDYAHRGQFDHLGVVTDDPDAILRYPVVVWRPPPAAVARPSRDFSDPWSRGLWYLLTVRARRGVCVYHDEARRTLPTTPHPWAAEMVDVGAGRGLSVVASTQGASRVYPPLFEFARHWFLFRLGSATQRGSLTASLEVESLDDLGLGRLAPHTFLYWRQGMSGAIGPFSTRELGARRQPPRPVFGADSGPGINSENAVIAGEHSALTTPAEA